MSVTVHTPAFVAAPPATPSRRWLSAGAWAGPVFLLGSFAQLPLNPGFDLTRHAFSFLSNGPHGWIQQVVFVLTGLLFLAAGMGLGRSLTGRLRVVAGVAAALVGVGLIVAGVWPPDPSFGYPAGAPAGYPAEVSLASVLHGVGFAVAMTSWVVLLVTFAVVLHRRRERRGATATLVLAAAVLSVPALQSFPFGTVWLYVVVTTAFLATSAVLRRLDREA
jgi:Protein of unknown function (DUF998)